MNRETRSILGFAGLACVACCIGPILAVLGGIGLAGLGGIAIFGVGGAAVGLIAVPVHRRHRRRGAGCRTGLPATVPVSTPVVRRSS